MRTYLTCAVRIILSSLFVLPTIGHASTLIDLKIEGEVTEIVSPTLMMAFNIGDSMSATITYDPDTPIDSTLVLTQGLFQNAIKGGSFSIQGYSGTINIGGNILTSDNDPTLADSVSFRAVASAPSVGTLDPSLFGVIFEDLTASVLTGLALPITTADLSSFPTQLWGLGFGSAIGTTPPSVLGNITSIQLMESETTVPAPASIALVGLGLAVLGLSRRKQV